MKNNNPVIILSRTAPEFLAKLLEIEVPEIFDGLIVIKKIVRDPGERAKVAVESYDDRIDPVGACVGMKGSRIHGIVRELKNENIDVINYTANIQLLIQRSLTPARITSMELDTENKHANVYLAPDQVAILVVGDWKTISAGDLNGRAKMADFFGGKVTHLPLRDPMTMEPMAEAPASAGGDSAAAPAKGAPAKPKATTTG